MFVTNCWSTSLGGEASWSKVGHRHGTPGDLDGNQTGVVGRQWYDGNMSWKHDKNMSEISDLIWGWSELNWHDLRIQNLGKVEHVLDTANLEKNRILNLRQIFEYLEDSQVIRLRNVFASVIQRWFCKHVDQTLLRVDSCSVFRNKNQSSRRSWKFQPTKSLSGTTLSRFIGRMSRMNVQEMSLS